MYVPRLPKYLRRRRPQRTLGVVARLVHIDAPLLEHRIYRQQDTAALARRRGAEFVQAIAREFPDAVLLTLFMNSINLKAGASDAPDSILARRPRPWAVWTANAATGEGQQIWQSPNTLRGSVPNTHGGTNLHWAARGRIVFLSYEDGWPHLYSLQHPGDADL